VAFQWPGPAGLARAALIYNLDKTGRTATLERQGPWALFRLLEAAKVQRSGEALIADLSIGGQTASYQINVVSPLNPLVSPLLREFRCPSM
jgi:type VI secretion system protein ImpL